MTSYDINFNKFSSFSSFRDIMQIAHHNIRKKYFFLCLKKNFYLY